MNGQDHTTHAWLLGGPTGVGKTTALGLLQERVPKSALLDADDVWRIADELAYEGTRSVAIANVVRVMQGYFRVGAVHGIVAWVFARPQLYAAVMAGLRDTVDAIHPLYLTVSPEQLKRRLEQRNEAHRYAYAMSRLELIERLPYPKIDTTDQSPQQVADAIAAHIRAST